MATGKSQTWRISPTLTIERRPDGRFVIERDGGGLVIIEYDEAMILASLLSAMTSGKA